MARSNPNGYNQNQAAQIQKIQLPRQIRCPVCRRHLIANRFSNTQLNEYRSRIYHNGEIEATQPICVDCNSGGQRTEMLCTGCDFTRPLDEFSKAQRKKSDNAKCIECQQEISDREPDVEAAMEEDAIMEKIAGGSGIQEGIRGSSLAVPYSGTNSGMSLGVHSSVISTEHDTDGVNFQSAAPITRGRSGSVTSDMTSNTSTTTTGTAWDEFTRQDQPYRQRVASNKSASTSGKPSNNPGFVNLRAVPDDVYTRAARQQGRNARKQAQQQARLDDGDDEEEEEDWEL